MADMVRKRPEMIIFDYGGTIISESEFQAFNGQKEIFRYATANPMGLTAEQMNAHVREVYARILEYKRAGGEIHQHQFMRLAYESIGMEFSLSYEELERMEWDAAAPGESMPHVEELLEYLHSSGIRTGVISNIGWSGAALSRRINRLLPDNHFEFIIASSEYGLRKPDPLLFRVALQKASLPAESVWYCGDTPSADVLGAHGVGMFPVLFTGRPHNAENPADLDGSIGYLTVHDWRELITLLENM